MSFPTKITFKTDIVTGTNGDRQGTLGHATIHNNLGSILNQLQDKIGVDGSTDPNSLDYKVSHLINDDDVTYNHIQITTGTTSTYGITFGDINLFRESSQALRLNSYISVDGGVGISNGNIEINNSSSSFRISNGSGNYDTSLSRKASNWFQTSGKLTVLGDTLEVGQVDSVAGNLTLFGNGAGSQEGGEVSLALAADWDTVFESWEIDVNQDDLRFFSSDGVVVNKMTAEGQLQLGTSGSGAGIRIGGDVNLYRVGADVMRTDDYFSAGAGLATDADSVRVVTAKTPASAAATGDKGQICWDTSFMYVCINTNTWKRVAIATW